MATKTRRSRSARNGNQWSRCGRYPGSHRYPHLDRRGQPALLARSAIERSGGLRRFTARPNHHPPLRRPSLRRHLGPSGPPGRADCGAGGGVRRLARLSHRPPHPLHCGPHDHRRGTRRRRRGAALGRPSPSTPTDRWGGCCFSCSGSSPSSSELAHRPHHQGLRRKAARGEWLGGPGPYGYVLDSATKTLVPEPHEAAMVEAIFAKYVEERSGLPRPGPLAQRHRAPLASRPTLDQPDGAAGAAQSCLLGKIAHGDDLHDGKHEAIIDDERLRPDAQKLLDERAAESTTIRPTTSAYLLSGKLRCQSCGGSFVGAGAHGRNGYYRYYVCRTRQKPRVHGAVPDNEYPPMISKTPSSAHCLHLRRLRPS